MKTRHILLLGTMSSALFSISAHAGVTTDAHGNQGYDTAAECDAAVQAGEAKFYQSFTTKPALVRKGESGVRVAKLGDLSNQYHLGACDVGAARKLDRDGVSKVLQGKYIPYSPNMLVNAYLNKGGQVVRVTMKQCDNWFSGNAPRPVPVAPPKVVEVPKVIAAPVVAAPVVVAAAKKRPKFYVFGSLGTIHDGAKYSGGTYIAPASSTGSSNVDPSCPTCDTTMPVDPSIGRVVELFPTNASDSSLMGGLGIGVQFTDLLGAELFMSKGAMQKYTADDGSVYDSWTHAHSLRLTVGTNLSKAARVFGKIGVASVVHHDNDEHTNSWTPGVDYLKREIRPMAGLGLTYNLTNSLAARFDFDHFFKRSSGNPSWKNADYLGLGLQYSF